MYKGIPTVTENKKEYLSKTVNLKNQNAITAST
jgi:hypothetical protein